jgi:endoglucanase Acf2
MKKIITLTLLLITVLALTACDKSAPIIDDPLECGVGYHIENDICILDDIIIPETCDEGYELVNNRCLLKDDFTASFGVNTLGEGSYYNGYLSDYERPLNPAFLDQSLLDTAVPSSGWWTSLLVANYGGSNGIYTNPLRIAYSNKGMEITNPEDGFVQYWYNDGNQTIAQFPIALQDTFLKSTDLNEGYETRVINYSDAHVEVGMRNVGSTENQMVATLVQGSPYVFVDVLNKDSLYYTFDVNGVDNYEYYTVDGTLITDTTYTGNAIVVKLVHRHSGYDTAPPASVLAAQYSDKYYLVNAPQNTQFTITSDNHPFGLNNKLEMSLGDGNYISIAALNTLDEAPFYHQHGYNFITDTDISYTVDYQTNIVTTTYTYESIQKDPTNDADVLIALMPHHYKNATLDTTNYSYRTVRGTLKIYEGNSFTTELKFNGLLPGFTTPTNEEFSQEDTVTYLQSLDNGIDLTDSEGFINKEGPYWNSKAIYPLAQGIIISDQLGETALRDSFIEKLKYVLEDWYTYSGETDEKFLFYNETWGSVYYSNDDFGTASQLSDHSFTHGYLIYASSVLAMYDTTFVSEYGEMVDLLLDDYMYPRKDGENFEYLRNFDPFAGHSWAHGYGTFAEGNNLESTSEALNSWNGGYLWAVATGDQERMDAAIYGFVTELSAIKEYWFDYDETNWDPAFGDYVDVAGMVWGGKHDYATWFGANPTFIYGIQWLPTGEYLTNYALTQEEFTKLSSIYATYLDAKGGEVDTWYSNMWAIESIINPTSAINNFDATKILNDDYPNELVGSYWMIHSLASLQQRTSDVWMAIHPNVSSTIYQTSDGVIQAMIWNPSTSIQTIQFYNNESLLLTYTIQPNTFETIILN